MPVMKLESSDARKSGSGSDLAVACQFDPLGLWKQSILQFLRSTVKYGSIYGTWTNDIDPDPSFESAVQVRAHNVVLLSAIQIQLIHKLDSMCDIN